MKTTTEKYFDTMVFKMEVDSCVKRRYMLKEKFQKAYFLVLGKFTKLLKVKLKNITGWSQSSTIFDVLDIFNLIKFIISRF